MTTLSLGLSPDRRALLAAPALLPGLANFG